VLVEPDTTKRDLMIKEAFEIAAKDFGIYPAASAGAGVGRIEESKLSAARDNQVCFYWANKQD
jgi:peptide/nickel transport system substrate-binding protein